jgi:hypothetical protein
MSEIKEDKQSSLLVLAQYIFEYDILSKGGNEVKVTELKEKILALALSENMVDYYVQICTTHNWSIDTDAMTALRYALVTI